MIDELLDDLRRWQKEVDALPPSPWCIRASHSVPYGQVFRQWDTRGRLIVWANRGEIADLPRAKPNPMGSVSSLPLFGIPVVY